VIVSTDYPSKHQAEEIASLKTENDLLRERIRKQQESAVFCNECGKEFPYLIPEDELQAHADTHGNEETKSLRSQLALAEKVLKNFSSMGFEKAEQYFNQKASK
jgi:hypothetical protein